MNVKTNITYKNNLLNFAELNLMNTFRKLWEQHSIWTRTFIISTAANLPDIQLVTDRLLRNPTDMANQLRRFYGPEKAAKFEELLKQHLLIAGQLVNDTKAGNRKATDENRRKWYQNADAIASFLASINPSWSEQKWKMLLYDHLKMVEAEAVARLTGQYATDIKLFDAIEEQALKMADTMAFGIMEQFEI